MAISEAFSGTATIGTTEYSLPNASTTLTPQTDDGCYQPFIDLSAMTAGESYRIRIKDKARSGDTQRAIVDTTLTGVQAEPLWVAPSLILLHGWDVTIAKTAGTDRAIAWSIRKVA